MAALSENMFWGAAGEEGCVNMSEAMVEEAV
jgi:hypothetical protein